MKKIRMTSQMGWNIMQRRVKLLALARKLHIEIFIEPDRPYIPEHDPFNTSSNEFERDDT